MQAEILAARRRRVLERLGGGVLVLPAARVARRNGDVDHAYRQESDLLYLSGFAEPEAVLVLKPDAPKPYTLFVRPRDKEMEIWNGRRAGVEGALRDHGADQAFTVDQLDKELPGLLAGAQTLWWPLGLDPKLDERIVAYVAGLKRKHRTGVVAPERIADPAGILAELRLFKDAAELERLRTAAELTARGHRRALAAVRPGMREYELEAELIYEFRKGGGEGPGYEPIVAAGANATVLHYPTGRDELKDGDLVLIDCGCEYEGYTADVTRTFPVNGRFSPAQRELYDLVLETHRRCVAAVRPGATTETIHDLAVRTLVDGMLRLGLLTGSVEGCIADKSFRRYYMHRTSHWLGLDVHDAGAYLVGGAPRPLAPGMVLTIEPGLYVAADDEKAPEKYRGLGIRVEDDVLVTGEGGENLTESIPRSVEELEQAQRR